MNSFFLYTTNMDTSNISNLVQAQRDFFSTGKTKDINFRKQKLIDLRNAIRNHEKSITQALFTDLGKSEFEAYSTEVGIVLSEISFMIKNIKRWSKPKKAKMAITSPLSKSFIYPEPYGTVFIASPWNYPFQLALVPLATAVCSGNCVTLKPSSSTSATNAIIAKLVSEVFEPEHVCAVMGGHEVHDALLAEKFDFIFFTGSPSIGKKIMEAAAKHLTPVSLELGGKSPCIVDENTDIKTTARRIVWGKFLNAGQTCVAPDYVLVHKNVKDALVKEMLKWLKEFFGENPLNPETILPSIVNERHFNRLLALSDGSNPENGKVYRSINEGMPISDSTTRKIVPAIVVDSNPESPVMQDEIFGPVLPVISVENMEEAVTFVDARSRPLALYLFTENKRVQNLIVGSLRYGGGCINDTVLHLTSNFLPFGGVGESGMGNYHGKYGFDTFSHYKSVLKSPTWFDFPFRYAPYKNKIALARLFLR